MPPYSIFTHKPKPLSHNHLLVLWLCFGTNENVFFDKKTIEQVDQYKYLGVIVRSINKTKICSLMIIGSFLKSPQKLYSVSKIS